MSVDFSQTLGGRRRLGAELRMKVVFGLMAASMVIPLLIIVLYLIAEAWPVLSWEFISQMPRKNLKEGGILSAILGTFYMVGMSLVFSAPVGVLAAVYLNEYARDNWVHATAKLESSATACW